MKDRGLKWELQDQHLILLPEKGIYWTEQKALIVSDLHIGKVGHFRKAGIAIPKLLEQEELAALSDLIDTYRPQQIIFLGDLFHSEHNNDWNWLALWTELFPKIKMILVKGNHDVLHEDYYDQAGFLVVGHLILHPFRFTHEPESGLYNNDLYSISGHIHPAVVLKGKARQTLVLPCFYFNAFQAVMPAFGKFTGKYRIKISSDADVFGILGSKVLKLSD